MLKVSVAIVAALFATAPFAAHAQNNAGEKHGRLSAGEFGAVTDLRVQAVKAALQLTSSQEKYWPAIEDAIRTRAKHRAVRLENIAEGVSELRDSDPVDIALKRNPVDFMRRRADALAQRSGDLKKLAEAWQPLYEMLSPDQKRRMALLRVFVFREAMNRLGHSESGFYDEEE